MFADYIYIKMNKNKKCSWPMLHKQEYIFMYFAEMSMKNDVYMLNRKK